MHALDSGRASVCIRLMAIVAVLLAPSAARAQWRATAGAESWDQSRQALAFLPNELWIHAGDDVTWTFEAGEIHTVTFLATSPAAQVRPAFQAGCPGFVGGQATFDGTTCITTPPLVKGATFTVAFPAAGNFKVVCLVHPDMTGVVHVVEKGKALPHNQTFYDAEAAAQTQALLSDRDGMGNMGSMTGHIKAGSGEITTKAAGAQTVSVMRFIGTGHDMVIHAGQTVEWDNEDPEDPHTITFGTEPGNPFPPSANVTMDEDGARHAVLHFVGESTHSGFIVAAPQDRTGLPQSPISVTRFRVTFTKAGMYPYICALHDDLGMKGKIIVVP